MKVNNIVISQPWGGLGDNLQFSSLPKFFSNYDIDVYISEDNSYRNEEIKKLVWDHNPFVKFGTPDSGKTLNISGGDWGNLRCTFGFCEMNISWVGSIIDMWEEILSEILLSDNTEIKKTDGTPLIYYKPKKKKLDDVVLVDLSSNSTDGEYDYNRCIDWIKDTHKNKNILLLKSDYIDQSFIQNSGLDFYEITDIFDYCDSAKSCDTIVTSLSGSNSICSGIGANTTCIIPNRYEEGVGENSKNELPLSKMDTIINPPNIPKCADFFFKNIQYVKGWKI